MIDCSHRLGKRENGNRPVIVKFCSRNTKHKVYNNKRKFKGTKIVVREDLTEKRHSLMREVQKKYGTVWSSEGNIFAKVREKIYKITNYSDFVKLNSI